MSKIHEFGFATNTATMCVFDLARLKHKLSDDADWWTTPDDELEAVNKGDAAFIGLGSDGAYKCTLVDDLPDPAEEVNISVPSGNVFIGAAEEVTADGLEPELVHGGIFLKLEPSVYSFKFKRQDRGLILSFSRGLTAVNNRTELVRI